jgi:hypothetical protein
VARERRVQLAVAVAETERVRAQSR